MSHAVVETRSISSSIRNPVTSEPSNRSISVIESTKNGKHSVFEKHVFVVWEKACPIPKNSRGRESSILYFGFVTWSKEFSLGKPRPTKAAIGAHGWLQLRSYIDVHWPLKGKGRPGIGGPNSMESKVRVSTTAICIINLSFSITFPT